MKTLRSISSEVATICVAKKGDWCEVRWLARAIAVPSSQVRGWLATGKLRGTRATMVGSSPWRVSMASVVSFLAKWSQTKVGSRHLARIGALELARRRLIDESTRDRIEAARARKAIAALGTEECDD